MIEIGDIERAVELNAAKLLKFYLPDGRFVFGGQYSAPSPRATPRAVQRS